MLLTLQSSFGRIHCFYGTFIEHFLFNGQCEEFLSEFITKTPKQATSSHIPDEISDTS